MNTYSVVLTSAFFLMTAPWLSAQISNEIPGKVEALKRDDIYVIDLPTVLRLANAQNLDIQIAREKFAEAKANQESATLQFFPWLSPGITYRRHDNYIQDVGGTIFKVHKQSYSPGATLGAQLDIGDAIYKTLAAKQQVNAVAQALESQRQQTAYLATQDYFDLLYAQSLVRISEAAVNISTNYQSQVKQAVESGVAFKGDELRIGVQSERNRLALRQVMEQQRIVGSRLAQTLRLDPTVPLIAQETEMVPLHLSDTNATLASLVAQGLANRPETRENQALVLGAQASRKGATRGPLIPALGAQYFAGGLGGDSSAGSSRFGEQEDFFASLSWKIGSGGLFDTGRKRSAESRLHVAELVAEKTNDEISTQIVESAIRVVSLSEQLQSAHLALKAAEQGLELARLRREFAVGIVLENIQAEQDLTRARGDYLRTITEFNKAQYTLQRALGKF